MKKKYKVYEGCFANMKKINKNNPIKELCEKMNIKEEKSNEYNEYDFFYD